MPFYLDSLGDLNGELERSGNLYEFKIGYTLPFADTHGVTPGATYTKGDM